MHMFIQSLKIIDSTGRLKVYETVYLNKRSAMIQEGLSLVFIEVIVLTSSFLEEGILVLCREYKSVKF